MAKQTKLYRRVKVWSIALRIFHWAFAFSCIILILTGLYINNPYYTGMEYDAFFSMGDMRYYHFTAAYIFMSALAIRIYLLFFGNRYERFTDFLPINRRNINSLFKTITFYLYLSDERAPCPGHNPLAGTSYFVMFILGIIMSLSGLYLLYPEVDWIASIGTILFGSQQTARFWHYIFCWCFILFFIFHIYISVWNELRSSVGLISGIINGFKFEKN